MDYSVIFRRLGIFIFFLPIGIFGTQPEIFSLRKHKFSIKSKNLFGYIKIMLTFAIVIKSNNIMDTIIFEGLKSAYERAKEIGETQLAKDIYKLTYENLDWWERDEDEYNTIFNN